MHSGIGYRICTCPCGIDFLTSKQTSMKVRSPFVLFSMVDSMKMDFYKPQADACWGVGKREKRRKLNSVVGCRILATPHCVYESLMLDLQPCGWASLWSIIHDLKTQEMWKHPRFFIGLVIAANQTNCFGYSAKISDSGMALCIPMTYNKTYTCFWKLTFWIFVCVGCATSMHPWHRKILRDVGYMKIITGCSRKLSSERSVCLQDTNVLPKSPAHY